MRQPSTIPEVQAVLRDLDNRLRTFEGPLNVEIHGRRVINAGDGIDGGDYVTLRQLKRLLLQLGNPAISRLPATEQSIVGEGGHDVFVNGKDVVDPNFNDNIPSAPSGYSNVLWQFENRGGRSLVSGYAASGAFDTLPNTDVCGIVGGLYSRTAGISAKSVTPFCSQAGSQIGRTEAWVMPTPCWLFNARITQSATETTQSLGHVGFERDGTNTSANGTQLWAFSIPPLAAGPATYGGGNQLEYFNVGDTLKLVTKLNGAGTTILNPHWSACAYPTSSNRIPLGFWISGPGGSTTNYGCYGDSASETAAADAAVIHPAGTLKKLYIRTVGAQPAGFSSTVDILKNGSTTGLTVTIPASAGDTSVFSVASDVAYNGTSDTFNTKITTGAGAGTSAVFICSLEFEPTDIGSAPLVFFVGRAIGTTLYYLAPFDYWNTTATEANAIFPLPRGGTIAASDCYAYLTSALTAGHTCTIKLRVNGSDSTIVWNITSATATGAVAASGNSVTVAAGDYITISQTGSGGSGWLGAIRIVIS